MSLLSAANLGKAFGPVDIFKGINLSVPRGARIAIVGPNGIGKTTLLRILLGMEEASAGTVQRARNLMLGYLPQEASLESKQSLWEECLNVFNELRAQEAELARLEAMMSDPGQAEEALERYGRMQAVFEHQGGYTYEQRIRQTLTGLGFDVSDYRRPLTQLSGGQRTRALLARLLLSNPDVLILDEPTNHLDIAAVEWLEGYLATWEGTALIVSHDRYFLDKVVDHIWEMSRTGMEAYRGNYSAYVQQRQDRWEQRQQLFDSEKERLEKELDFVRRNISGQNVTQARGRFRRLSRQVQALEQLGVEAVQNKRWLEISGEADITTNILSVDDVTRRIRGLPAPTNRPPRLHLHLKPEQRSGNIVLRAANVVVGYPGEALFEAVELELRRLECAAIIGPNGAGKTTFLKTILAQLPPLCGEVTLGASLQIGYFAQAHEGLQAGNTLVQEIETMAPGMLLAEIRNYLAKFLFTGEDVFRQVATLSGGERGRLALAKLALTQANLLLLDEPTNHLDIPSQEILQEVLSEYQGTILLVSHDRYLIDALGTQIWEIDQDERALRVFRGTYSEQRAQMEAERAVVERAAAERLAAEVRLAGTEVLARAGAEQRGELSPYRRRARLNEVEVHIAALEARLAEVTAQLEDPPADPARVQRLGENYMQLQEEINTLLAEWEGLHA